MTEKRKVEAKEVAISELPNGYAKARFTEMVIDPATTKIWVVAKEGVIHDWAVYFGWPTMNELKVEHRETDFIYYTTRLSNPEGVEKNGDKLSEQEARALFPEWNVYEGSLRKYRR